MLLGACPVTAGQRTDVKTPELVQLIRQGCPLTLGIKPLMRALTRSKTIFRLGGVYTTSKGWTGISS